MAERRDVVPGSTLKLAFRSGQSAYAGEGPPSSRGSSCIYVQEGGSPMALNPCPVTDGDLFSSAELPGPFPGPSGLPGGQAVSQPTGSVTVDLGSTRRISLVVVRGCSCKLEASPDGQSWTELDTGSDDWLFAPPGRVDAISVRLSG